jgi:hypothetical protein
LVSTLCRAKTLIPYSATSADQVRGLGGDVHAGGERDALERALLLEPLADLAQHRHRTLGPLDPALALRRQPEVGDVVLRIVGHGTDGNHGSGGDPLS